jgi:hypothetical protein
LPPGAASGVRKEGSESLSQPYAAGLKPPRSWLLRTSPQARLSAQPPQQVRGASSGEAIGRPRPTLVYREVPPARLARAYGEATTRN